MDNSSPSESAPEDLSLTELRQQLREARIDRDGWHIQARLSNNHLQRILRSPAWRLTKPFRILNLIAWKIKPELHDFTDIPWAVNGSGPTVWETIGNEVKVEALNADLRSSKIAVLAHWADKPKISRSLTKLIQELIRNSYEVVLVSACESNDELEFENDLKSKITVLRKPNYGYDFGSWSVALSFFPDIFKATEVLILNDSNAGPFGSLSEILQTMSDSPFDITGITDSLQIRYHIQSYMMHFKNSAMQKDEIWDFWTNVRHQDDKQSVIQAYELGLTSRAQSSGLFVGAIYPWNLVSDYWENPTIHGAERLIDLGLPLIKREIIRDSSELELLRLSKIIIGKFDVTTQDLAEFFK